MPASPAIHGWAFAETKQCFVWEFPAHPTELQAHEEPQIIPERQASVKEVRQHAVIGH